MKKLLLLISLITCFQLKAELDASGLTPEQAAKFQLEIERIKATNKENNITKPEEIIEKTTKYAELGKAIGIAIGETAKSLNVAVNDFVKTPVGQITCIVIAWKILGRDIIRYGVGYTLILSSIILWIYLYKKAYGQQIKKVEYTSGWWIFRGRTVEYVDAKPEDSQVCIISILGIVIVLFTLINTCAP